MDGAMNRFSILVADDDEDCREAIQTTLAREGFETHPASCGAEAIEIVRRRPSAIHASILDMHMPDLTGIETLTALTKAMEAGAFTILHKPVSSGLIVVTVNMLLGKFYGEDGTGSRRS
jgi:CheY-like chemotaxis protein